MHSTTNTRRRTVSRAVRERADRARLMLWLRGDVLKLRTEAAELVSNMAIAAFAGARIPAPANTQARGLGEGCGRQFTADGTSLEWLSAVASFLETSASDLRDELEEVVRSAVHLDRAGGHDSDSVLAAETVRATREGFRMAATKLSDIAERRRARDAAADARPRSST